LDGRLNVYQLNGYYVITRLFWGSRMQQTGTDFDIAVVGGGFSGASLAAALLRGTEVPPSVILLEREADLGRGVAYGTRCGGHLLNVRAQNMSGLVDDPLHFHVGRKPIMPLMCSLAATCLVAYTDDM
jgi:choline dehydrogenase-like flavoprotein